MSTFYRQLYVETLRRHLIRYHVGRRLLAKVRACGVAGQVAHWIGNWIRDRKQRVAVSARMF